MMNAKICIVALVLGIVFIVGVNGQQTKKITMTEYDGPRIIATHEVTPQQVLAAEEYNFQSQKFGGKLITIERALYEGIIDDGQYGKLKASGSSLVEVRG